MAVWLGLFGFLYRFGCSLKIPRLFVRLERERERDKNVNGRGAGRIGFLVRFTVYLGFSSLSFGYREYVEFFFLV